MLTEFMVDINDRNYGSRWPLPSVPTWNETLKFCRVCHSGNMDDGGLYTNFLVHENLTEFFLNFFEWCTKISDECNHWPAGSNHCDSRKWMDSMV